MRLLVLGGTRFLGRALVEEALAAGHEVTLFNRGRTNPGLFPDAEHVAGDRTQDLASLAGREWDAVFDVAAYFPRVVRLSAEALRGRVGRYVFVSSVSVYTDPSRPPVESSPVAELHDPEDATDETYGARKAACERIVADLHGDAALLVRPGLIVGPHDSTDRFTYWPRRIAQGGRVLAPGDPADPVQFVDVRDLARWMLVPGLHGVFNATGETISFGELLDECRRVTGSGAEPVWVPSERLLAAGLTEWMGVPLWIASPGWEAANRVVVAKAVAAGLTFRPLADTIRDTLAWDAEREWPVAEFELTPEREAELLAELP